MTNEELNKAIRVIEDKPEKPFHCWEGLSEKCFPYFGWFWRNVDWDRGSPITISLEGDVGIDVAEKWGYSPANVPEGFWPKLRAAFVRAVTEQTVESFKAVADLVQSLNPKHYKPICEYCGR